MPRVIVWRPSPSAPAPRVSCGRVKVSLRLLIAASRTALPGMPSFWCHPSRQYAKGTLKYTSPLAPVGAV